jgi:transposase
MITAKAFSDPNQLLLFIPGPAVSLAPDDRFRLFAQKIRPRLEQARPALSECYCPDLGRPAIEPVLLLALTVMQFLERVGDAQAVEFLNYHSGWAFAVGWQMGQPLFHPSALCRFRKRLLEHRQASIAFDQILEGLVQEGLVQKRSSRRFDSTFVLGLVSRMGRLECVRETLRLALEELEDSAPQEVRPGLWRLWRERYVENRLDFRAKPEALQVQLRQAGEDIAGLLCWIDQTASEPWSSGAQVELLRRVFAEQFEAPAPSAQAPVPVPKEKTPAGAVKNPHEPQAQWAKKGSGAQKKEVIGYKTQIGETVGERPRPKGHPTEQFLTAIETQWATASDERGLEQATQAEARVNLLPPPVSYVDAAYISGHNLAQAKAQGRELIGPAPAPPSKEGRYSAADFDVSFEPLQARCPAGHLQVELVQWQDSEMGGLATRFDWAEHCQGCPLRAQCIGPKKKSRTLAIGPHHELLQARRREQTTPEFRQRSRKRNALEGTQSELVRAHGLRKARYRGLEKVRLQNYFIGAACNAKRWIRLLQWHVRRGTPAVCQEPEKN